MADEPTNTHTPGPWHLGQRSFRGDDDDFLVMAETSVDVKKVGRRRALRQLAEVNSGEANAHLIAAAPELLDALRGLVLLVDGSRDHPLLDAALAAIAKAEGR